MCIVIGVLRGSEREVLGKARRGGGFSTEIRASLVSVPPELWHHDLCFPDDSWLIFPILILIVWLVWLSVWHTERCCRKVDSLCFLGGMNFFITIPLGVQHVRVYKGLSHHVTLILYKSSSYPRGRLRIRNFTLSSLGFPSIRERELIRRYLFFFWLCYIYFIFSSFIEI